MQVGRADLDEFHAELPRQEARQGNLELRVGEEEDALAGETMAMDRQRPRGALAPGRDHRSRRAGEMPNDRRPPHRAMRSCLRRRAERERPAAWRRAPRARAPCRRGTAAPAGSACWRRPAAARRRGAAAGSAPARCPVRANSRRELVLDDIGAARRRPAARAALRRGECGSVGHQRGQAGVFALREGRLDAAAGIVEHAHAAANVAATAAARRATGRA